MRIRKDIRKELMFLRTVPIVISFPLMILMHGHITPTYDGWWAHDTLPKVKL